ncbi:MAG: hypothetical protein AAF564_14615 [Bacteroidota bacterium]
MFKSIKHVRSTVGMGLLWAIGWASVGVLTGIASSLLPGDPLGKFDPGIALALPGFLAGLLFFGILRFARGDLGIYTLSLAQIAGWGLVTGLLLALLPLTMGTLNPAYPAGLTAISIVGILTLLSALSAVGVALILRIATRK